MIQYDEHISQRGLFNHQLGSIVISHFVDCWCISQKDTIHIHSWFDSSESSPFPFETYVDQTCPQIGLEFASLLMPGPWKTATLQFGHPNLCWWVDVCLFNKLRWHLKMRTCCIDVYKLCVSFVCSLQNSYHQISNMWYINYYINRECLQWNSNRRVSNIDHHVAFSSYPLFDDQFSVLMMFFSSSLRHTQNIPSNQNSESSPMPGPVFSEVGGMYLDHRSGWCLHEKLEVWGTKKGLHQKLGWFVEGDLFLRIGIPWDSSPSLTTIWGEYVFTSSKHRTSKSKTILAFSNKSNDAPFELSCVICCSNFCWSQNDLIYLEKTSGDFDRCLRPPNQLGQVG